MTEGPSTLKAEMCNVRNKHRGVQGGAGQPAARIRMPGWEGEIPHGSTELWNRVLTYRCLTFLYPVSSTHVGWIPPPPPHQGMVDSGGSVSPHLGSVGYKVAQNPSQLSVLLLDRESAFHPPNPHHLPLSPIAPLDLSLPRKSFGRKNEWWFPFISNKQCFMCSCYETRRFCVWPIGVPGLGAVQSWYGSS